MPSRFACAVALAFVLSFGSVRAQHNQPPSHDLQGIWNGATLTPLQRPPEFKDTATFTPEQAAEYERTSADRIRNRLPTSADRLTQADVDDMYVESEVIKVDHLRTSLIVDPPNGVLPPLLPAAQARVAARPKRTYDDPEAVNLAERCLLGNFGLGGSTASPPMLPSPVVAPYYQIVQTDTAVMIFTEWMHDTRIIRMNAAHLPPGIKRWLGDSVGHWEGDTLVVDTTNFRPDTHQLDSSERLHVVERFTRIDPQTLRYRVTVDDPDTWATAWTAEWPFRSTDARLFGVDCHEGNYAVENFLRGARAEERGQQPVR